MKPVLPLLLLTLFFLLGACAEQKSNEAQTNSPAKAKETQLDPLESPNMVPQTSPAGADAGNISSLDIKVTTPGPQRYFLVGQVPVSRNVKEKTVELADFKRTIEKTKVQLSFTLPRAESQVSKVELYGQGKLVANHKIKGKNQNTSKDTEVSNGDLDVSLSFETPALSAADREKGFASVGYDLVAYENGQAFHHPFTVNVYDESQPTLVVARPETCVIYHQPTFAEGPNQNRTRTPVAITAGDNYQVSTDVSVQYSGQATISASIVQFQLGIQRSKTVSTQVGNGTQIQEPACIECAYGVYRQLIDHYSSADIFRVRTDGSLLWSGRATVNYSSVGYEPVSTPSESKDYRYDLPFDGPVGKTPGCAAFEAVNR